MKIEFRSIYFLGKQADQHNNLEFLRKENTRIHTSRGSACVIMISAAAFFIAYFAPICLQNRPDLDALSGAFAIIGASMLWIDTNSSDPSLVGLLWPDFQANSKSRWWSLFLSAILLLLQIIIGVGIIAAIINLMFDYIPSIEQEKTICINKNFRRLVVFLLLFATVYIIKRVKMSISLHYEKLNLLFRREISKIEQSSTHNLWKAACLVSSMRAGIRSLGLLFLIGSGAMVIVEHMLDILLNQSDKINFAVLWIRSFNAYKDGSI